MLQACRCPSLASRLVNGRHIATIRLTEIPATRPKPYERQILKTGIFSPFHPVSENPLLRLERDMELLVHPRSAEPPGRLSEHHSVASNVDRPSRCSSPPPPSARANTFRLGTEASLSYDNRSRSPAA